MVVVYLISFEVRGSERPPCTPRWPFQATGPDYASHRRVHHPGSMTHGRALLHRREAIKVPKTRARCRFPSLLEPLRHIEVALRAVT